MLNVFKKLKPFARPYFKKFIAASLCSLPLSAVKGYQAYYVKKIFDVLLAPRVELREIIYHCGVLLGLQLLQHPFRVYHYFTLNFIAESVTFSIREKLFQHFQRLPVKFFDKRNQGDLFSIALSDTVYFAESIKHVVSAFREPLTAIALLSVAIYHDWFLTIVILAALPIFGLILSYTGKKIKKHVSFAQERLGVMSQNMTEAVQNHKIVKAYQLQDFLGNKFSESQKNYLESQSRAISYEEHSHPAIEMIGTFAVCLILVIAHNRITGGHLSPGAFVSFAAALALFMDPIKKFNQANVGMSRAKAAVKRIFSVLGEEEEKDGEHGNITWNNEICFKNVSFKHGDVPVLNNINLKIAKGEKLALVGRSGSGKSTLVSLLLGLYPLKEGEILIDDKPIRNIKKESLRSLFSYVGQDVYLFNDTVKENLTLGEKFPDEYIEQVSRVANLSFVDEMEHGWDSVVGDRGAKLSGGQNQRLTLARALLKSGEILVLDEATSALDNELENKIKRELDAFAKGKTVIAVAHRLSTVQDYDRILVLDKGEVIEEGTHEQLLQKSGEYKKLYELSLKG